MEHINDGIEEVRKYLTELHRMSKKDAWTLRERKRMAEMFNELETTVRVLRLRCGLA